MAGEIKWWRRIDIYDTSFPFCLSPDDNCFYYRDYIVRGGYQCSETNQLIFNLKKRIEDIRDNPSTKKYKDQAISCFVDDSSYFFENLIKQGGEISVLLIPVPSSHAKTDPTYDDRLIQVVTQLSKRYPSFVVDEALAVTETLKPSHLSGPRSIDAFQHVLQFEKHVNIEPELIVIIDDLITSGAH